MNDFDKKFYKNLLKKFVGQVYYIATVDLNGISEDYYTEQEKKKLFKIAKSSANTQK